MDSDTASPTSSVTASPIASAAEKKEATASATTSPTASAAEKKEATASPTDSACSTAVWYLCQPFKWIAIGLIALGLILVAIFYVLFRVFGSKVFIFLVPRPHVVATTVDSVSLAQFTLSANSTLLQYNITLATTIHNPNKRISLYFHEVESMALFEGKRFGYAQLQDFYQRTRSSTQLTLAFQGQQPIEGDVTAANFRHQQAGGVLSVDVKLNAKLGKKVRLIPEVKGPKVKMNCNLALPANGNASAMFKPTDCQVSYCIICR